MAYSLALIVFEVTRLFPKEEKYSLTDQIVRSSRSIPANIAEAWQKRKYSKMFVQRLIDASGETGETLVWLDFSYDHGYLTKELHFNLSDSYIQLNKMLIGMIKKPEKFCK